jgi:HSF-type DNA-binding
VNNQQFVSTFALISCEHKKQATVLTMCVTNSVRGRARPVRFRQNEIDRIPLWISLKDCTYSATAGSSSPSDKELVKVRSRVYSKRHNHGLPPGQTAKHHERQFVIHDYHDHSQDKDDQVMADRGYSTTSSLFPVKLHAVLEEVANDGLGHIISWAPHGRCFSVHMPRQFVEQVLPK